MPETDITSASASENKYTDYSVTSETTDGASGDKEFRYQIKDYEQNLGYYKKIPELRAVIDARTKWTLGKGYQGVGDSKEMTEINLMIIKGIGNESFNTILGNLNTTMDIAGDAFAEIMRDEYGGIINLKVLDPSVMVIIFDSKGMITGYEQMSKTKGMKPKKLSKEKILHFTRNRTGDEIHGISLVEALVEIILMRNEAMQDWKRVQHRNIDPVWIYHMDTDDTTEIAAFKTKMDLARGKGENIYVPKGVIVPEVVGVSNNAILNAMTWIENLNDYFYEVAGVPRFIVGNSKGFTEAAEKIGYLAFQQTIEEKQLYNEEQVLSQLGLEINLEFPASLENELISDNKKDEENGAAKPSDTEAGAAE